MPQQKCAIASLSCISICTSWICVVLFFVYMQRQMIRYAMLTSRKHAQIKKRKKQRSKELQKPRQGKRKESDWIKGWTEAGRLTVQKKKVRRLGNKKNKNQEGSFGSNKVRNTIPEVPFHAWAGRQFVLLGGCEHSRCEIGRGILVMDLDL